MLCFASTPCLPHRKCPLLSTTAQTTDMPRNRNQRQHLRTRLVAPELPQGRAPPRPRKTPFRTRTASTGLLRVSACIFIVPPSLSDRIACCASRFAGAQDDASWTDVSSIIFALFVLTSATLEQYQNQTYPPNNNNTHNRAPSGAPPDAPPPPYSQTHVSHGRSASSQHQHTPSSNSASHVYGHRSTSGSYGAQPPMSANPQVYAHQPGQFHDPMDTSSLAPSLKRGGGAMKIFAGPQGGDCCAW